MNGYEFAGTMAVQERHRLPVAPLERYLEAHVDGFRGPLEIEQFKGGQSNPTYRLTAGGKRYVLRRKPPGELLPSAHAVDREYRVITALRGTDVPVARTWCLCDDPSVIGTTFYVMDYVEGRVLWDAALPEATPADRAAIYAETNRVMAALHRLDHVRLGLADYGKAGNYFERQISRWAKQYRASETERIDAMDRLVDWLPAHIPARDATTVVHGDYRVDNIIFHPTEPRVLAVLDWELSTIGHPLADFAYHCMNFHVPRAYGGLAGHDLARLGIPSERAYVEEYCRRLGQEPVAPDEWRFYIAFSLFRVAGMSQGIMKRALTGTASSRHAVEYGRRTRTYAELGWEQVEQERAGC